MQLLAEAGLFLLQMNLWFVLEVLNFSQMFVIQKWLYNPDFLQASVITVELEFFRYRFYLLQHQMNTLDFMQDQLFLSEMPEC